MLNPRRYRSFPVIYQAFSSFMVDIQHTIHFQLIFVKGIRLRSRFTLPCGCLVVSTSFVEKTPFIHCIVHALINDQLIIFMWVYFWGLYFVTLISCMRLSFHQYSTVLITAPLWYGMELGNLSPPVLFFVQHCIDYTGSLASPWRK